MELRLRDIRSEDKAALVRFHRRLSAETRYRRYHAAKGDLTTSDLRYLTELDGHTHAALIAQEEPSAEIAGVARIVADAQHPGEAEVAIVVRDDVHRQGLGAGLVESILERGRREGVETAVAQVQADNHRALRLFQGLGFRQRGSSGPVVELVRTL